MSTPTQSSSRRCRRWASLTIAAAAETDQLVTVFTGRGRKEQYAQFREWCDDYGLEAYTLPAFTRDCDTANGEHGQKWAERVRDWYRRGATPQEIHKRAEAELGRPLPCQVGERACMYTSKWQFEPDDFDVLIGHYAHAHKQPVTQGRTAVVDEFPGDTYETILDHRLADAVTHFLQGHDDLPFTDYAGLIEGRHDVQRRADGLAWFQARALEPDEDQVFEHDAGHAATPLAVFTILAGPGDDLGNGWERAPFDDGVGLFDREQGRVILLRPPPLEYCNVVALDGTPTLAPWQLALGLDHLNHRQVLGDAERTEYLRDILDLQFVRTTDAIKP
jgi:hypothetical protein